MDNTFLISLLKGAIQIHQYHNVITEISTRLQLNYIPENEEEGRVCLALDPDVRPEYRISFTDVHLHDYILGALYLQGLNPNAETAEVPYPVDAKKFWDAVQKGSQVKNS